MEKTDRIKMPLLLKAVLYSYIGWYGVLFFTGGLDDKQIMLNVVKLIGVSIFSGIFAYGVVCLILDFKKGGINYILKKIIKLINGKS